MMSKIKLVKRGTCPVHGTLLEPEDRPDPRGGRCEKCDAANAAAVGYRKAQPKREPPGPPGPAPYGRISDPADFARYLRALGSDPVRLAEAATSIRRPKGVTSARFGVAVRAAGGEPLLNASPKTVGATLAYNITGSRTPKAGLFKSIIVKPNCYETGKISGWSERRWTIHRLKYSSGLVAVTDRNEESKIFPDWGNLRRAIQNSGWSIIR